MVAKICLLGLIRCYQVVLSPDTGVLRLLVPGLSTCRFRPRCSEYAYQAIIKYGTIRGLVLGWRRLLRCHPWSDRVSDPVP